MQIPRNGPVEVPGVPHFGLRGGRLLGKRSHIGPPHEAVRQEAILSHGVNRPQDTGVAIFRPSRIQFSQGWERGGAVTPEPELVGEKIGRREGIVGRIHPLGPHPPNEKLRLAVVVELRAPSGVVRRIYISDERVAGRKRARRNQQNQRPEACRHGEGGIGEHSEGTSRSRAHRAVSKPNVERGGELAGRL